MDLTFGTATFDPKYGVLPRGQEPASVLDMISTALSVGITRFDTAPAYGGAEALIGQFPERRVLEISTKVYACSPLDSAEQVAQSLERLRVDHVASVLIHDWGLATDEEILGTVRSLLQLRSSGMVGSIGCSVYDEQDLEKVIRLFPEVQNIQLPINLLDQRCTQSWHVSQLLKRDVQFIARSVFLQGILLAPSGPFNAHPEMQRYWLLCDKAGVGPLSACLGFVRSNGWLSSVVVGAANPKQLLEISSVWSAPSVDLDWSDFAALDTRLIDPRKW